MDKENQNMANNKNVFISDAPISSCEADISGRSKIVKSLAENILREVGSEKESNYDY